MKRRLSIVLVLGVVGSIVGGLFIADDVANSEHPGEDLPEPTLHTERIDESEGIDGHGPVVEYDNLTAEQQAIFERALEDDDNRTELPDGVDATMWYDSSAVTYQNKTYRVTVSEP